MSVDLIDREETVKKIMHHLGIKNETFLLPPEKAIVSIIRAMSPQKRCCDCKYYDSEDRMCKENVMYHYHRWSLEFCSRWKGK